MARLIERLSDRTVRAARKPGKLPDGDGLYLQIGAHQNAKSWLFRFEKIGKQHEMGLGPYPSMSLAAARDAARECRKLRDAGIDPLQHRRDREDQARQAAKARSAQSRTFKQAATEYINDQKAGWRNAKHSAQWQATLGAYAYPRIGAMAIGDVDTDAVLSVLRPIWTTKTTTATRVRQRIEKVLQAEKALGNRTGENPALWRGHLDTILPRPTKLHRVTHHAEVAYGDVPALYSELRQKQTTASRALVFTILTAARSNEVRGARWSEIDLPNRLWSVPAERKKSGNAFRVPLSTAAVALLESLAEERRKKIAGGMQPQDDLIFAGARPSKPISENTMRKMLQEDMGHVGKTVHGFRASFRDWIQQTGAAAREVAEVAMSHAVADETEAAYLRGDMIERRRKLMDAWGRYCSGAAPRVLRLRA